MKSSKTITIELPVEWLNWIDAALIKIKEKAPYSDQTRAGLVRGCFKTGARDAAKLLGVKCPEVKE